MHTQTVRTSPLLALLLASVTGAQAQIATPAQFVQACQSNPANTVVLTQQTKFQTSFQGTTFSTPSGCTVVLGTGASLELDTITMSFGGAFVVQGANNTKLVLDKATLTAASIDVGLTGFEGQFQMNESRFASTTGDLSLRFGEKGSMEVKQSGGWYQPRLAAKGVLSISTGALFSGNITMSGLQGARGMSMAFNGTDSTMKLENTDLLVSSGSPNPGPYTTGAFSVTSSAQKVAFETTAVRLMEASQAVNIALSGAESKIGLVGFSSMTGSKNVAITALGEKGEVKIENSRFYGNPNVIVESGSFGTTTVMASPGGFQAQQLVRIRAGTGGSCSATASPHIAPVLEICR
jgi:hypothetical protein